MLFLKMQFALEWTDKLGRFIAVSLLIFMVVKFMLMGNGQLWILFIWVTSILTWGSSGWSYQGHLPLVSFRWLLSRIVLIVSI